MKLIFVQYLQKKFSKKMPRILETFQHSPGFPDRLWEISATKITSWSLWLLWALTTSTETTGRHFYWNCFNLTVAQTINCFSESGLVTWHHTASQTGKCAVSQSIICAGGNKKRFASVDDDRIVYVSGAYQLPSTTERK